MVSALNFPEEKIHFFYVFSVEILEDTAGNSLILNLLAEGRPRANILEEIKDCIDTLI